MKKELDFSDYSLSELEHFILKSMSDERKRVFYAAKERVFRLNKDFAMDESFLEHFIKINERLTFLMNELYDKMLSLKASLNTSIRENKLLASDFELEGFIDYEDPETEDIEIPEWLCNIEFSGQWSLYMSSNQEISKDWTKEDHLMSKLNWDIETFDAPMIKERNIWVCYMMHSLYCDRYLSLPDLMQMKPECFYISVKSHFNF